MRLDDDLGIDSIKRVEILSAVQDRLPETRSIGPGADRDAAHAPARSSSSSSPAPQPAPAVKPPSGNGRVATTPSVNGEGQP